MDALFESLHPDWSTWRETVGQSDRRCRCGNCMAEFEESDIVLDGDDEFCPFCLLEGCMMDLPDGVMR